MMGPALLLTMAAGALPLSGEVLPAVARDTGIDEHLGQQLPLDSLWTDQDGHLARLGSYFDGRTPTILVLAYYQCPMLCGLTLRGVAEAVHQLPPERGQPYRLLTVSFDPRDSEGIAKRKQYSIVAGAGDLSLAKRWPFVVGEAPAISALTAALGFRYGFDERTNQFAHPAAIFILTPEGHISRYFYGVTFRATDLKLALLEAGEGKSGSSLERLILTCFHFDPATQRYGPYLFGFLRVGSALVFLSLAVVIFRLRRRERVEHAA